MILNKLNSSYKNEYQIWKIKKSQEVKLKNMCNLKLKKWQGVKLKKFIECEPNKTKPKQMIEKS